MAPRVQRVDILIVGALLLIIGAVQFHWQTKLDDVINDATYLELANSIAAHRPYGFDFRLETLFPPGFPLILAGIYTVFGRAEIVLMRSMTVFFILGLGANYLLLRRVAGRKLAAAACLLLATSPDIFAFSTQAVISEFPYFLVSTIALILALQLSESQGRSRTLALGFGLTLALAFAVMIRSAGIVLPLAILSWAAVSIWRQGRPALIRFRRFAIPVALAVAIQGGWMAWAGAHERPEWPIGGWPKSYASQFTLKSGNEPELGRASAADIGRRAAVNVLHAGEFVARFILHKQWKAKWYAPAVLGTILLVSLGLGRSFCQTGGGLLEWYFLGYGMMYILWPWDIELRFPIPVAPLAFLYLWRGIEYLLALNRKAPIAIAASAMAVAASLAAAAWGEHRAYFIFWFLAALVCGGLTIASARGFAVIEKLASAASKPAGAAALVLLLAGFVGSGIYFQRTLALGFQIRPLAETTYYSDIEAAQWIRGHVPPNSAVMARKLDLVYHYSGRRVIWFPPISHSEVLMDGIRKYHVGWVVVTVKKKDYWRPSEAESFSALRAMYPDRFHLAHQGPNYWIYAVGPGA